MRVRTRLNSIGIDTWDYCIFNRKENVGAKKRKKFGSNKLALRRTRAT